MYASAILPIKPDNLEFPLNKSNFDFDRIWWINWQNQMYNLIENSTISYQPQNTVMWDQSQISNATSTLPVGNQAILDYSLQRCRLPTRLDGNQSETSMATNTCDWVLKLPAILHQERPAHVMQDYPIQSQSSPGWEKSPNQEDRAKPSKFCRVCGDKALGFNFDVVTCESCKAFFRRNALKKTELRCPFQENCNITINTRRYCPKCRLRKCFQVGMRPERIMNDYQRIMRRRKRNINFSDSDHDSEINVPDGPKNGIRSESGGHTSPQTSCSPTSPKTDRDDFSSPSNCIEDCIKLEPPPSGELMLV